jgi:hypothetical protein
LFAYVRGHPGWAVGLACAGFASVFAFAFAAVLLGIVLHGDMMVGVAIWGAVAVYWLIATVITYSLGPKPPR